MGKERISLLTSTVSRLSSEPFSAHQACKESTRSVPRMLTSSASPPGILLQIQPYRLQPLSQCAPLSMASRGCGTANSSTTHSPRIAIYLRSHFQSITGLILCLSADPIHPTPRRISSEEFQAGNLQLRLRLMGSLLRLSFLRP